jgi:hypothetical protein
MHLGCSNQYMTPHTTGDCCCKPNYKISIMPFLNVILAIIKITSRMINSNEKKIVKKDN